MSSIQFNERQASGDEFAAIDSSDADTSKPSNPGSAEAVQRGCQCAVMDNEYGRGCGEQDERGNPLFWISGNCPLHAQ
jgi:hypothetical protein